MPSLRRPVDGCPLTDRQMEVLLLGAQGLTNREIAARLGRSENTIRRHRDLMFKALAVHSMAGAVGLAYREGWL